MTPTLPFAESQSEAILAYLKAGNKITPMDALRDFQCFRLGGRIYDLKKLGHKVQDEWFVTPSGKRVKRYYINTSAPQVLP